jgi:cytochrome bd-type quinol oxidase subunit 2
MPLEAARWRLAASWLVGAGAVFIVVVLQSVLNHYEDSTRAAWEWLLPSLLPILGVIVTTLGQAAHEVEADKGMVRRAFYRLALSLSIVYLVLIALIILVQPFVAATPGETIESMRSSNLYLAPLQGLVAAAVGVVFLKRPAPE